MSDIGKHSAGSQRPDIDSTRRESGAPGGGSGRRDEVGPTGVYPMSGGIPAGKHLEVRTPAAWGQGERGAEGYNDSGTSELVMREGQLLGGLTSRPSSQPAIDVSHRLSGRSSSREDAATNPRHRLVLTAPELVFVVATRAALAAGIGLLAASRVPPTKRRVVGATLALFGALATIPAVLMVRNAHHRIA